MLHIGTPQCERGVSINFHTVLAGTRLNRWVAYQPEI